MQGGYAEHVHSRNSPTAVQVRFLPGPFESETMSDTKRERDPWSEGCGAGCAWLTLIAFCIALYFVFSNVFPSVKHPTNPASNAEAKP